MMTAEQLEQLDEQGFCCLGVLLDEPQLQTILERVDYLLNQEGENAGSELFDSPYIRHPSETGADRLADLVNKGDEFDVFYSEPVLLECLTHLFGENFKLSSLNYRAARPGAGEQKLHVDWHEPVAPHDWRVCNSIWLLDDFSSANGATRVVPGTHLSGKLPQDELDDPLATHPDEVIIEAPAGTVFVFNSHLWHGGTQNRTESPRRAIHSYFCRSDQPQQVDQSRYLSEATRQRVSPEQLGILGIE